MQIRNLWKIFISKFSAVYVIMLYMIFAVAIIASVSLFAIVPVYEFLQSNGIAVKISDLVVSFVINGYSSAIVEQAISVVTMLRTALTNRMDIFVLAIMYIIFILGALCRLIIGMIELPILKKLQGALSDNANYGFFGLFISTFGKSALFSLTKLLIKFLADMVIYLLLYFIAAKMIFTPVAWMTPFVVLILLVPYYAFKYGLTACWGASIAVDNNGIFKAFSQSWKFFFANFVKIFSLYLVVWILVILVNFIVIRYTFGAGIVLSVPTSMLVFNVINVTIYYTYKGYRYYAGDLIVDNVK